MYTTSRQLTPEGKQESLVIPLDDVVAACHIAPQFKQLGDEFAFHLHPDLLSYARRFYFNHYSNHFIFGLVEHWRAVKDAGVASA